MIAAPRPGVTHRRAVAHGHLRDLAQYCGVSVLCIFSQWKSECHPGLHEPSVC